MRRFSIVVASLAFVFGAMLAPALADVHWEAANGVILIRNQTHEFVKITEIRHMVGSLPGIVIDRDLAIPPNGLVYANRCCYAAGSVYRVSYAYHSGAEQKTGSLLITMGLGTTECARLYGPVAATDEINFHQLRSGEIKVVDSGRWCQR